MERTFIMLKPDTVQRCFIGKIISRLERRGLKLVGMKFLWMDRELAGKHYAEHVGKPFYESLVAFITSGPVVPMVWEGKNVVEVTRQMMGKTNPVESDVGTIRDDFAMDLSMNIIHGSDSNESAKREIANFFSEDELVDYTRTDEKWVYPPALMK